MRMADLDEPPTRLEPTPECGKSAKEERCRLASLILQTLSSTLPIFFEDASGGEETGSSINMGELLYPNFN